MVLLLLWLNWYLSFCLKSGTREKENISLCFGFFRYCSYYNSQVTHFFHLLSHITIFFSFLPDGKCHVYFITKIKIYFNS